MPVVKWMKAIFLSTLLVVLFTASLAAISTIKNAFPITWERYLYGLMGLTVATVWSYFFLKKLHLTWQKVGLRWQLHTVPHFGVGLLIGVGITVAMISVQVIACPLTIVSTGEPFSFS